MPRPVEPNTAWAVRPEILPALAELGRRELTAEEIVSLETAAARSALTKPRVAGAVQILSLRGLITPRPSFFSMLFGYGGGGLTSFAEMFDDAVNDDDVGAIVIDIDSPGGRTDMVPETAAQIRAARGSKPIIAVCNTMAASAAYWLAAQADEIVVTPSGWAGSVGVFCLHWNYAGMNDRIGIEPTYVSAGRYKTDGNEDEPLSDTARQALQQTVDDFYGMFITDVAAGRGATADQVRNGYGEGRLLTAQRAIDAGLADSIETLEDVISRLLGTQPTGGAAARAAALPPAPRADDAPDPDPDVDPEPDDDPDDEDDDEDDLAAVARGRRLLADLTFG